MSLVPALAEQHAAHKARMARMGGAGYRAPALRHETSHEPAPLESFLSKYRIVIDTTDPVIDTTKAKFPSLNKPPRWRTIVELVSIRTGVSPLDIESSRRDAQVIYARFIAFWLTRTCTTASLPLIGTWCGGRDHTTVLNACKQVEKKMAKCKDYRREVEFMRRVIDLALAGWRRVESGDQEATQ